MEDSNDKGLKALYATAFVSLILAGVLIAWIIHSIQQVGAVNGL